MKTQPKSYMKFEIKIQENIHHGLTVNHAQESKIKQLYETESFAYIVINWPTLVCCFTNLQKTSTVQFNAFSFSCTKIRKAIDLISLLIQVQQKVI